MEKLNKIELAGIVGRSNITPVGNTQVARFSLATNYSYSGNNGEIVIDTTWFSVIAWAGEKMPDLDKIQKGSKVHLVGRVRMQRYVDANGCERYLFEIVAQELEILEVND